MDPFGDWYAENFEPVKDEHGSVITFEIDDFDGRKAWDLVWEYGYGNAFEYYEEVDGEVTYLGDYGNVVAEFRPVREED